MMSNLGVDACRPREASYPKRNGRTTLIDLSIVAGVVTSFFWIAVYVELAEQLAEWARGYEHWQVDKFPLTLMLLSIGLAWFGWRRWCELRLEVSARCLAEVLNLRMLAQNRQLAQQLILPGVMQSSAHFKPTAPSRVSMRPPISRSTAPFRKVSRTLPSTLTPAGSAS